MEDDYVYTGHGRFPYQHIPQKYLEQYNDS